MPETLAARRLRGDGASDGVGEEIVLLVGGDVAEGGIAERHQRDICLGDARVGVGLVVEGLWDWQLLNLPKDGIVSRICLERNIPALLLTFCGDSSTMRFTTFGRVVWFVQDTHIIRYILMPLTKMKTYSIISIGRYVTFTNQRECI